MLLFPPLVVKDEEASTGGRRRGDISGMKKDFDPSMLPLSLRQRLEKDPDGRCILAMAMSGLRLDPTPTVKAKLHKEFGLYSGDRNEPFGEELFNGKVYKPLAFLCWVADLGWVAMWVWQVPLG